MHIEDITLLVGVDSGHLQELTWVWPTWTMYKPEILQMRMIVFYDEGQVRPEELHFIDHPQLRLIPWTMPFARSQREKMLSAFIHLASTAVETPWHLKLDTDLLATGEGEWIKHDWFKPSPHGELPAFITSSWGYSRPRYVIDLFDDWGDTIDGLREFPRLDIPYSSSSRRIPHSRIVSWLYFGNTIWTKRIASWLDSTGRLPFPSHDTYTFYCAKRTGAHTVVESMTKYQWSHLRLSQIKRKIAQMKQDDLAHQEEVGIP